MNINLFKAYLKHLYRRRSWILYKISFRKIGNMFLMTLGFLLRRKKLTNLPFVFKIDASPDCQLRCPVCIHSRSEKCKSPLNFSNMSMALDLFEKIVNETKGITSSLCLHYLGEPFMSKNILEMVSKANQEKFSTFFSSNFSFNFTKEYIRKIVDSGLTSLTVCLDGLTQEVYERSRIGGKIDYVLTNLENLQEYKKQKNTKFPQIEIQFLKFSHNAHQLPQVKEFASSLGVHVYIRSGTTGIEWNKSTMFNATSRPKRKTIMPKCAWPWVSMVIKWNGDVIPCCSYRFEEQYDDEKVKSHAIGNIYQKSIREIWNGEQYQQIRAMVIAPTKFDKEEHRKNFCYGCKLLYDKLN